MSEVRIIKVDHFIPINVSYEEGGVESVLTAYIDYGTNTVHLPKESCRMLADEPQFREKLAAFMDSNYLPEDAGVESMTLEDMEDVRKAIEKSKDGASVPEFDLGDEDEE